MQMIVQETQMNTNEHKHANHKHKILLALISSALANTPCTDLGVNGVLEKLNATLGTAYNLDLPCVFGKVLNATPQRNHSRMERLMKLAHFNWTVMDTMTPNSSLELEWLVPIGHVVIHANFYFT